MDIDYTSFKKDINHELSFLKEEFNFEYIENKDEENYLVFFRNQYWGIEFNLIENFPYIGLSFKIFTPMGMQYIGNCEIHLSVLTKMSLIKFISIIFQKA